MRWLPLVAFACGGTKPAPPATSTAAPDAAVPVAFAPDATPPPDAPGVDRPGHYATLVIIDLSGSHNMQWVTHDSRASAVLDLADDGSATLCYAHASTSSIESDSFDDHDKVTEQRGYRGGYTIDGDTTRLALTFDDTVCPTIFESTVASDGLMSVALTCTHDSVEGLPAFLCDPVRDESDFYPLMIHELVSSKIILGPGPGLTMRLDGKPLGNFGGRERTYQIARGDQPLEPAPMEP